MDAASVRVGLLIPALPRLEATVQACSGELRSRALKMAPEGLSARQAAIRLGVDVTTTTPWLRRFRASGDADFILVLAEAGTTRGLPSKEVINGYFERQSYRK